MKEMKSAPSASECCSGPPMQRYVARTMPSRKPASSGGSQTRFSHSCRNGRGMRLRNLYRIHYRRARAERSPAGSDGIRLTGPCRELE